MWGGVAGIGAGARFCRMDELLKPELTKTAMNDVGAWSSHRRRLAQGVASAIGCCHRDHPQRVRQ